MSKEYEASFINHIIFKCLNAITNALTCFHRFCPKPNLFGTLICGLIHNQCLYWDHEKNKKEMSSPDRHLECIKSSWDGQYMSISLHLWHRRVILRKGTFSPNHNPNFIHKLFINSCFLTVCVDSDPLFKQQNKIVQCVMSHKVEPDCYKQKGHLIAITYGSWNISEIRLCRY